WTFFRASPPTTSPTWRRRWRRTRRAPTAASEPALHAREEVERSLPGGCGRAGVVANRNLHIDGVLVAKRVLRVVTMNLKAHTGGGELPSQGFDTCDREEGVLGREVTEQRRLDLGRVQVLERRVAVPVRHGIGLGDIGRREQRQRAAHAEAVDADLA